jgi:hypothetical protein
LGERAPRCILGAAHIFLHVSRYPVSADADSKAILNPGVSFMISLLLAAIAFVGAHFLLSHPLRAPLVRAIKEGRLPSGSIPSSPPSPWVG